MSGTKKQIPPVEEDLRELQLPLSEPPPETKEEEQKDEPLPSPDNITHNDILNAELPPPPGAEKKDDWGLEPNTFKWIVGALGIAALVLKK